MRSFFYHLFVEAKFIYVCYICLSSFKIICVFYICKKISVLSCECCHRFTTITLWLPYILLSITGSFFIAINSSIYIYLFSGIREADINVAEGKKRAKVLNSEAFQIEQINIANGMLFTMIKLSKIQFIFHKFCSGGIQS